MLFIILLKAFHCSHMALEIGKNLEAMYTLVALSLQVLLVTWSVGVAAAMFM